jgi:hypothetical protein
LIVQKHVRNSEYWFYKVYFIATPGPISLINLQVNRNDSFDKENFDPIISIERVRSGEAIPLSGNVFFALSGESTELIDIHDNFTAIANKITNCQSVEIVSHGEYLIEWVITFLPSVGNVPVLGANTSFVSGTYPSATITTVVNGANFSQISDLEGWIKLSTKLNGESSISIPVDATVSILRSALLSLGYGDTEINRQEFSHNTYKWIIRFKEVSRPFPELYILPDSTNDLISTGTVELNLYEEAPPTQECCLNGGTFILYDPVTNKSSPGINRSSSSSDLFYALKEMGFVYSVHDVMIDRVLRPSN